METERVDLSWNFTFGRLCQFSFLHLYAGRGFGGGGDFGGSRSFGAGRDRDGGNFYL